MTEEQRKKFETSDTLLEKVQVMLKEMGVSEIVYNEVSEDIHQVEDIAMIQCFHGTDIARIRATVQAIEFNLRMTSRPSSWIFVECQKSKSECSFGWLKNYGVEYVFVKSASDCDGILLKSALWNIGARSCTEENLCFVDSDVVMCQSNWIGLAKAEFDSGKDVLSLASHQYYQEDDDCRLYESVGHMYCRERTVKDCHCGFTVGIRRPAWEEIGGFDPEIILDDIHFWRKIMGDEVFSSFQKWVKPFSLPESHRTGYNLRLGWIDNVACHVWHGSDHEKYKELTELLRNSGIKSESEIIQYSWKDGKKNPLPRWVSNTGRCRVIRDTILEFYAHVKECELNPENSTGFDIVGRYRDRMAKTMGCPDKDHPLFVCSTVKNRFGLELEDFIKFRDKIAEKFMFEKFHPVVLFFTDCTKFDFKKAGINAVPLLDYNRNDEFAQCMRGDLKYPKNTVVYYVPFGFTGFKTDIWIPDVKLENPDGTVVATIKS